MAKENIPEVKTQIMNDIRRQLLVVALFAVLVCYWMWALYQEIGVYLDLTSPNGHKEAVVTKIPVHEKDLDLRGKDLPSTKVEDQERSDA